MVVDERANLLIFHTAGEDYQQLLPLIKRLDVLPKQIILEVMIAEVTLTDEFKQGVEFAFTSGAYGLSTAGAFMGDGFGGLSYLLQGENGSIALNLFQANSNVNVLSRPSIVVRDGVNASISVGTDIPIVGQTVTDPLNGTNQTTTIEYRKTGVELSVTPTVNAQGVILMEIKQSISNQLEVGATVAGSPSVFERSINTEVVAESGQSIVLGGLISESRSSRQTKVPVLGDLPFIGKLFQAETESGDKTELVVFVTPRLIESSSEWDDIILQFTDTLNELVID
jgi:general secretion pathway protein D